MESLVPPSLPIPPVTVDDRAYPKTIRNFLAHNRTESERFVRDAGDRERWLLAHDFRVSADLCIDGRVSDFSEAVGLNAGLLEMYRSGGCRYNKVESPVYFERIRKGNRKLHSMGTAGAFPKHMIEMRMAAVHYSASRPEDASCAAWDHQTAKAVATMQDLADRFNHRYFKKKMIAFVVLVDTDLDALTVKGPAGNLSTKEYLDAGPKRALLDRLTEHLREIFPPAWGPLLALEARHRRTFYEELSEHLAANVAFVEQVRAANRPLELLIHQERMIFVGRPLETRDHNAAFLIEDREPEVNRAQFKLGMHYVLQNVITDAIASGDRDWTVPVLISVPHDKDDPEMTMDYALGIKTDLQAELKNITGPLLRTVTHDMPFHTFPEWLQRDAMSLSERVSWCTTTNDRRTRLFVPCD